MIKNAIKFISSAIIALVLVDLLILTISLAQIQLENRSGHWNSFWKWQAQHIMRIDH